jgi:hypothetical protein
VARDPDALRTALTAGNPKVNRWQKPQSVPVLMQMLMAEAAPVREVLAGQLARIEGSPATEALAQVALFDLHPRVRKLAVGALATRPAVDYLFALLRGFEHPWPVVADHAAEALVVLGRKDTVPALVGLLEKPDPRTPHRKVGGQAMVVKEMVRVNHLLNCLLCHPPSFNAQDKVRGLVPPTDRPVGSGPAYYSAPGAIFVRADITYLKQDFSAMQAVPLSDPWPAVQRFDFFVRERLATESDYLESASREKSGPTDRQRSLFFALRELSGRDPGPSVASWKRLVFGGG